MPQRDKEQRGREYGKEETGVGGGAALEDRLRITPVFTWAEVAGFEACAGLTPDGREMSVLDAKLPVYTPTATCECICIQGSGMLQHSETRPPVATARPLSASLGGNISRASLSPSVRTLWRRKRSHHRTSRKQQQSQQSPLCRRRRVEFYHSASGTHEPSVHTTI